MKGILLVWGRIGQAKQTLIIGFVIGEQPRPRFSAEEFIRRQACKRRRQQRLTEQTNRLLALIGVAPGLGIAQPEGGQQKQRRRL